MGIPCPTWGRLCNNKVKVLLQLQVHRAGGRRRSGDAALFRPPPLPWPLRDSLYRQHGGAVLAGTWHCLEGGHVAHSELVPRVAFRALGPCMARVDTVQGQRVRPAVSPALSRASSHSTGCSPDRVALTADRFLARPGGGDRFWRVAASPLDAPRPARVRRIRRRSCSRVVV